MSVFDLETEFQLSDCRKHAFGAVTLFLLVLLCYSNTFHASWHLDDQSNLLANRSLHLTDLSWPHIKQAALATSLSSNAGAFRPVARFSLALNYYLARGNIFSYHIVNLSIHILTAILLYLLIHRTLNVPLLRAKYGPMAYSVALLATALWALNPIQIQAVTYIIQRMTSMAGMFYVLSMYCYLQGRLATRLTAKSMLFFLAALAGLLALGSKENAVMLPVSLLLYEVLIISGPNRITLKKAGGIFLLAFALPVGLIAAFLVVQGDLITELSQLYQKRPFTPLERLFTEPRIILFYLSLLLYPIPARFSIDHEFAVSTSLLAPPTTLLAILFILAAVAGALIGSKKHPLISFCVLFFFLNHLVESTLLPLELTFEHRNYLPSMFLFVPVAVVLLHSLIHFRRNRYVQFLIAAALTLLIVGTGLATYTRNAAWQNDRVLWLDCLQKYPASVRANHNLGLFYDRQNERPKAIKAYHRALQGTETHSKTEKAITYFNLGLIAQQSRQYAQAMEYYGNALRLDPCLPGGHNNLALLMDAMGAGVDPVEKELRSSLACEHANEAPIALSNLGALLINVNRREEALAVLQKALRLNPDNPLTLLRLGYLYKLRGEFGTASTYFKRVLREDPGDIGASLLLGEVFILSGNINKARQTLSDFVEIHRAEEVKGYFDGLEKPSSHFRISPDRPRLTPYLVEAYRQKALSFQALSGIRRDH